MMLSGEAIKNAIVEGKIVIKPFNEAQLNPNSYNLRLSDTLLRYEPMEYCGPIPTYCPGTVEFGLDMKKEPITMKIVIPPEGFWLLPGVLYLGSTVEYTETYPPYVPIIEGRSSVGRLGMQIHLTAGFGDTFFKGTWTLELTVIHPLRIYSNVELCQIAYLELKGDAKPYAGKYQGQTGPRPSALWKEFFHPQ